MPALWRSLGLPGLVDVHVHFMPERVLRKVWAFFDGAEGRTGTAWPITYRGSDAERLAHLRAMGVRRFPALVYPHKPGMAAWLNDWAAQFAAGEPDVVPTATFYPEPEAGSYITQAVERGVRVVKVHLQVGDFDPRDPLLDPVWGTLAEAGVAVVIHSGTGPHRGRFTGVGPIGEVLGRHPRLVAVIAHMGMFDYAGTLDLLARHPAVCVDTTMAFTDFTERLAPYPRDLLPRLADLGERVVLGTDFPNIPHPYVHQLEALVGLGLGEEWLRAVLWHNGARLVGVKTPVVG